MTNYMVKRSIRIAYCMLRVRNVTNISHEDCCASPVVKAIACLARETREACKSWRAHTPTTMFHHLNLQPLWAKDFWSRQNSGG